MLRRLTPADRVAAIAALAGVAVAFLPWYSYSSGSSRITVNGFRASLLGDVFFLCAAATLLLVLMRQGVVTDLLQRRMSQRAAAIIVAGVAAASVLDQLLLATTGHHAIAAGLVLALGIVVAMGVAAWLRGGERPAARSA
jgi:hypothetical protein